MNLVKNNMLGDPRAFDLVMLLHHQISCRGNMLSMNPLSLKRT